MFVIVVTFTGGGGNQGPVRGDHQAKAGPGVHGEGHLWSGTALPGPSRHHRTSTPQEDGQQPAGAVSFA